MRFAAVIEAVQAPDLKKKILLTLGIITLFRVGSFLPTPGVNYSAVQQCVNTVQDNSVYTVINLFSGGALLQLSVFALGIMPYITASIIIQLLTVVIPRLELLKKEGQSGQVKMIQYTRYLTVGIATLQAAAVVTVARTPGALFTGCNQELVANQSVLVAAIMALTMVGGATLIMWLGEIITERGVGNGMSLLIFTSVVAAMPAAFTGVLASRGILMLGATLAVAAIVLVFIIFVEQGQRRVPIHYPKSSLNARGAVSPVTYIPFKLNMAGVIPVIFASSILFLPVLVAQLLGSQASWAQWVTAYLATGTSNWYIVGFIALIVFFTYFYVSITVNPEEIATNLRSHGGLIPGIRAGNATVEYLRYIISRLTAPGSVYLACVAALPIIAFGAMGVGQNFILGGVSLLILASVGLDTVKQASSQRQQTSYEGFLRR